MNKKILFFILILFSFIKVNAKIDDTIIKGIYINDPLYYEYKVLNDGTIDSILGNIVTVNDKLAYCIEPGIRIKENQLYSSYSYDTEIVAKDKLDYYNKVAYYGYGYKNHTTHFWKMAAQILIWEKSGMVQKTYASYDKEGLYKINLDFYQNEILDLVNKHEILPTFNDLEYEYYENDKIVIDDNNQVLNDFKISEDKFNFKIIDNKLVANSLEPGIYEINLLKDLPDNGPNLIYTSPNSQKVISIGQINEVKAKVKIKIKEKEVSKPIEPEIYYELPNTYQST